MRKIILSSISIVLIVFLIPILFTSQFESKPVDLQVNENNNNISAVTQYNYDKYGTIKLLHTTTNETEEIEIDTYLYNVVSAEMPADFHIEALKAQAVVARTYTIYKAEIEKKHENADICDSHLCCQAWISKEERFSKWEKAKQEEYWNKIVSAVDTTKGKVVMHNNQVINALFHSNSGGITELPVNVWGGSNYPYLQTVQTSGEDAYTQYASEVILTKNELIEKIKVSYPEIQINFEEEECIKILEYTDSDRIKTIKFGNTNLSGVEARTLLGLKSTNFTFSIEGDNITFKVIGYGHGVGLSQTGADALAKQGKTYEEIIQHYYKDVEIVNV